MVDKKGLIPSLTTSSDPVLKRSFRGHKGAITAVAFNSNLKQVASASEDSSVTVWNFKPQARPFKFTGHKGCVYDVNFSPDGNIIATGAQDTTIRLWKNSVNVSSETIKGHYGPVRSVNFSTDGRLLISSSDDKTIKLWNVAERKFLSTLNGHSHWVRSAEFSPDIRLVASGSDDKTVKIWDSEQKKELHTFYDHTNTVSDVKFHPDGTCVAACSSDRKIKLWDVRSKRLLQHYDAHNDNINSISFHPSGNYLVSSSDDSKIKIWDLRQGRLAFTLFGHEGQCTDARFSAGGDFFVSGGSDNIVMVWQSNFEENANEKIDDIIDLRPKTSSGDERPERTVGGGTGTLNNRRISLGTQEKQQTVNLSPSKLKKPSDVKKTNQIIFSTKDKAFHTLDEHRNTQSRFEEQNTSVNQKKDLVIPEQLTNNLDKIIGQLNVITKTLQVLEMRLGVNEEQISFLSNIVSTKNLQDTRGGNGNMQTGNFNATSENVFAMNNLQTGTQAFSETTK